jgi:hypothetical protein
VRKYENAETDDNECKQHSDADEFGNEADRKHRHENRYHDADPNRGNAGCTELRVEGIGRRL